LQQLERSSRIRWLLIFWIFLLGAVAFLDRVNISIAGGYLAREFRLSDVQLGYVFSSFLVGYAIFQTPAGRIADRLGPRLVIAIAVIWWGVFTALTASLPASIAAPLGFLISIRFVLGAGEAILYPASNQFVSHWIPTQERGIANGWIFAGVGVGSGLTPPLIAYIMLHHGWRSSFWISAAIGMVVGGIWFVIARDSPERHPWVSPSELITIQSGLTITTPSARSSKGDRMGQVPWGRILTSKEVLAMFFSYFTYGYAAWIFFSWFFIYLARVRGLNLTSSSHYAMLPFLAMAGGSQFGGVMSDWLTARFGKRAGRCIFSFVVIAMAAVFLVAGAYVASARIASVVLAGGAGALYLSQSCYWSVTADIAGPSSGSVSGFMNMGGQIGGAVTASLTPAIAATYGWTASFLVAAALCSFGAVAWLLVDPHRSLVESPSSEMLPL
jgi:MFS transporter, ACS family, glucarate transporter